MLELIPLDNVNILNVTGDKKCFECVMDLCSAKDILCLTIHLYKHRVQGNRSHSVG